MYDMFAGAGIGLYGVGQRVADQKWTRSAAVWASDRPALS